MPLHLTPLSRRDFVRGAALAGAALMLPRDIFAQAKTDENRFTLFSDTHIDANADLVFRDVHLADHLRACVREALGKETLPAGVFINGDCARSDGQAGDYVTLLSLVKPLSDAGLPLHLTLGNHDHRERIWTALNSAPATRTLQSKHVSLVKAKRANWVLLDSLDKVNVTPGLLDKEQRDWLAKTLDENADKPALVMVHHNPAANLLNKGGALQDTEELLQILTPRQHVKALFFGHTHVYDFKEKEGLHLINLPAVAYAFAKEQPTGWVDCNLTEIGATFELRAHDDKHPKHGKVKELKWR
jgi:3',5'-cyclic-AMP phosphodiesterase